MRRTIKALFTGMMAMIMLLEPATLRVYALDEMSLADPVVISEEMEDETLSDDQVEKPEIDGTESESTEDILSENSISENSVSENSVSENAAVPEETESDILDDDISVNTDDTEITVSEDNLVSENKVSKEESLSENEIGDIPADETIEDEIDCNKVSVSAEKSEAVSDFNGMKGKPVLPQIVTTPSADEKSVDVTISVQVGYICYTVNGKKPGYKYGYPENGTTCVRGINCNFKLKGETSYTIQAMNVTPDGKASGISKAVIKLEPKLSKLKIDGPTRVVPGKTVSYTVSTTPADKKLKNVVWSLDFPNGSMIEEYVSINEKSGKVKIIKNRITTSAVTLCNNPVFYVYATAVDGSTVVKSEKYTVNLADVQSVRSIKFSNKSISLKRGSKDKTYNKTDDAYKGKSSNGLIIYSPNDDVPMTDKDIEKNITFYSSNEAVATVDKYGNITAKKAGTTVIKAVSDDRLKKAEMKVTVVQEITKDPQILTESDRYVVAAGKKVNMTAKGSPENAKMSITWSVSPSGCGVSVNKKGVLSVAKKTPSGKYTIIASDSVSGKTGSKNISVVNDAVTKINMSADAKNLMICRTGKNNSVSFSVFLDKNESEYYVTTNRPGLVNVSAKTIKNKGCSVTVKATGYASGTAKVTVKATDGSNKSVTSVVTVTEEDFDIVLTQNKDIHEMYSGTSLGLTGTVFNTSGKKISAKISWGISPVGQGVTVKNGKVSASKNAKGGKYTVSCAINNQLQYAAYDITVNPRCTSMLIGNDYDPKTNKMTSEYSVGLGDSPSSRLQFYNGSSCITLKPVDSSKPVIIKNSKSSVADAVVTSKKDGYYLTLKGKTKGSTKITLTANDGSKTSRTFTVNVK